MILALAFLCLFQDPSSLVEKLRSESPEERGSAARALKDLGKSAVPALEKAAKDSDAEVAVRAKHLLKAIELLTFFSPAFLKALPGIEDRLAVGDESAWTRELLAAAELVAVRPDLRVADLEPLAVRALHGTSDSQVRNHVIESCSFSSAVPELIELTKKDYRYSWDAATSALKHIADPSHAPALLERFRDRGQPDLPELLENLVQVGAAEAIPDALGWITRPDWHRAHAAAAFVGDAGRPEALPTLLAIEHPTGDVIEALGRIGDPRAIPRVLEELKSVSAPGIWSFGAQSLARLGAREAIPELSAALENVQIGYVRYEILRSIAWLSRAEALALCEKGLISPSDTMRRSSVYTLDWLHARDRAPAIAKLIDDPDSDVRYWAISSLGRLGAKEFGGQIAARLQDNVIPVQRAIAQALANLGLAKRFPLAALGPMFNAADPWTQYGALEACGRLRGKDALPLLLPYLKSEHYFLRSAAGTAVIAILGKDAVETVRPLLRDPNCQVRYEVARDLVEAGVEEGVIPLLKETRDRRNPHHFGGYVSSDTRTSRAINGLRHPTEWKRLVETPLPEEMKGTRRDLVEKCAAAAGLKVEWSESCSDDLWLTGRYAVDLWEPPRTVLDGLIHLLQGSKILGSPPRFELILDPDKLRVLPYLEAIREWERGN